MMRPARLFKRSRPDGRFAMQHIAPIVAIIAALFFTMPAYARGGVPWCGLWMESYTGIHGPGNLALAREWAHVGHPTNGPGPHVIGVEPHHVFMVLQVIRPGEVLAISGNDGGAVRTRARSTAGVIAWRAI